MVTCYPQPGKAKSADIMRRFAAGARGKVATNGGVLEPGAAAFYGVVGIEALLAAARADGRDWYYADNSYFDATRGAMFRVGKNALQADGNAAPAWERWKATGLKVAPWLSSGQRDIVICEQSDHFMTNVACWPGGALAWLETVLQAIKANTDRPIRVRPFERDKLTAAGNLQEDLKHAWAVVTHTSAAANEALLAGVPVFVTGPSAAARMGSDDLRMIESPVRPDFREEWAAGLAGQQWSLYEFEDGTAWRALCQKDG